MDVLHMELPRAFTTTVKPPDFRAAKAFESLGISFDSVDINTHFWKFSADTARMPLEFDRFLDSRRVTQAIEDLCGAISKVRTEWRCPLTVSGLRFGAASESTLNIPGVLDDPVFMSFVSRYSDALCARLQFSETGVKVISMGVDSPDSLVLACALSQALRKATRCRIVLGRASYENFTLRLRRSDIESNAILAGYFDALVYEDERFVDQLAELVGQEGNRRGPAHHNDVAGVLAQSKFIEMLEAPPRHCVILMPFSRNRCYWKRCSFCVQIKKHPSDGYYRNAEEVAAAAEELAAFSRLGFEHVIFNDEAMSPANIRRLCDALESRQLRISWTPRVIADTDFDQALVERMARNGCIEALFGIETIDPRTAAAMGKVSSGASPQALGELLHRFTDHGLGLFLNFIYSFPTESDAAFEPTFDFARGLRDRLQDVTLQFNKFALFFGTDIYHSPDRYGITSVEPALPTNDLKMAFDYVDRFGRGSSSPGSLKYFAASLDLGEREYLDLARSKNGCFLEATFQVTYASFGLMYKHREHESLIAQCLV